MTGQLDSITADSPTTIEYLACAQWTTGAIFEVDGGLGLGVTFS